MDMCANQKRSYNMFKRKIVSEDIRNSLTFRFLKYSDPNYRTLAKNILYPVNLKSYTKLFNFR